MLVVDERAVFCCEESTVRAVLEAAPVAQQSQTGAAGQLQVRNTWLLLLRLRLRYLLQDKDFWNSRGRTSAF